MKSPQKVRMPVLQWSATHVVYRPANMHQNALMFVVPGMLCSRHGCEIRSNNRKSSMVTFNLSTVVPAARRANSKCIIHISHAAESIYIQGSVIFCSFLGGPKIENYITRTPKSSPVSRFFRGRVKNSKNAILEYKWP